MHGIVAYTFLNIYEKIHQFLSSIKRGEAEKGTKKTGSFFCFTVYMYDYGNSAAHHAQKCKLKGVYTRQSSQRSVASIDRCDDRLVYTPYNVQTVTFKNLSCVLNSPSVLRTPRCDRE